MCDDFKALDQTISHHIEQGTLTDRQWQRIKNQFIGCRAYFGETEISKQNDFKFIHAQFKAGSKKNQIAHRLSKMNGYCIGTAYNRITDFLSTPPKIHQEGF